MAGRESTAAIPTNIASQFINAVPQTAGLGIGAATGAANASRTMTSTPSWWDVFNQGLTSGGDFGSGLGGLFGGSGKGGGGSSKGGSGGGADANGPLETAAV